jgi:hypothetical protein
MQEILIASGLFFFVFFVVAFVYPSSRWLLDSIDDAPISTFVGLDSIDLDPPR